MVAGMKIPPGVKAYVAVVDKTQPVSPSAPPLLDCIIAELGGNLSKTRNRGSLAHNGVARVYELVRQDSTGQTSSKMITTVDPEKYTNLRLGGRAA